MEFVLVLGIGIIISCFSWLAIPLSCFISKMEDEMVCQQCSKKDGCFARKKSRFFSYDNMNTWMLVSFFKIRKQCPNVLDCSLKNKVYCFISCIILFLIPFWSEGMRLTGFLYGTAAAALLFLSIVDWNTQYIPLEMSGIILICGLVRMFADLSNWVDYIIGLLAVSGFLCIFNWIATPVLRKRYQGKREVDGGMGDGDIKLMAATGLLLGWKLNFLALAIGCIAGSVIHLILMKVKGSDRQFALGPYLSLGVYITMIFGEQLVGWYLDMTVNMMGIAPV